MRFFRTPKAVLTRLLCVLTVLLMLSGCTPKDEQTEPTSESGTISTETTEALQPSEIITEEASLSDPMQESICIIPIDPNMQTEEPEQDNSESETTEPISDSEEETSALEVQLSEELMAAQAENQKLQEKIDELSSQNDKQRWTVIVLCVAVMFAVVIAFIFLFFWRKADSALKKARKKNARKDPDVPITQVHVGKVHGIGGRSSQQDSFSVSPAELYGQNGLLAVVADGMGGLENGDKASQTAVISAMESFYQVPGTGMEKLVQMLAVAKDAVHEVKTELGTAECGTTLLMGLLQNNEFHYLSVGDSRIYLYRAGRLVQLNREHSYLYEQLQKAVNGKLGMREAFSDEKNACITSFLGMQDVAHVDIPATAISVLPKDKILLMSDGVYNALSQEEICLAMRHPVQDAAKAIESFIATKNFMDQDNYTLVILECR